MRAKFLFLSLLLFTLPMFGQGHRVSFNVNDDGKFYRTDDSKPYYVFEYSSNLDAQELKNIFYNKWVEIHRMPSYFGYSYQNSSFNIDEGVISGTTVAISLAGFSNKVEFDYKYRIQFRDGRVRIDAPELVARSGLDKYYPEEWVKMKALFQKKENAAAQQKQILEIIGNGVINEFLAFSEFEEEDWSNPQVIDDRDKHYFSLGNKFAFEFPDGKSYAVFKLEGLNKKQLMESIDKMFYSIGSRDKSFYDDVLVHYKDNGLEILGSQIMYHSSILVPSKTRFYYKAYIACEDNMVKVYVPKVYRTHTYRDKADDSEYDSFKTFLYVNSICKNDGTHGTGVKLKDIASLDELFNFMIFAPLYYVQEGINKMQAPAEEW